MTDFLKVLNFKQQLDKQTFKQALLHGDPGVIYPILTWRRCRKKPDMAGPRGTSG